MSTGSSLIVSTEPDIPCYLYCINRDFLKLKMEYSNDTRYFLFILAVSHNCQNGKIFLKHFSLHEMSLEYI